ncbi:MAG: TRAP transporter substrate-binding protein [Candidatus Electrothrix sp. AR5]|nr:TRAP transporter substrate-binding protein [Candidatus Electrothrix sp. AR5]
MALGDAEGGTQYEMGKKFGELLKAKTNGKFSASLFPNSQLGSEQETVQNCRLGTLDLSVVAINNITPFSPTVGLFTLPYMILDLDEAYTLTQGAVGQRLVDDTLKAAGVRIIAWAYSGFRVLTNSEKPVRTVADLKGLVIRVPKNAIMIDAYKSWGINPTPMAWDETFTALQQKVVDGQDNPYITNYVMKFYEVQKYITNIRYLFSLEPLIISEALFKKQSPEVQKAILEAGKEASAYSKQYIMDKEGEIKKAMAEKGMKITDPADNEKEFIEKATKQVWPKFYKSIGGKEKIEEALKVVGRTFPF